MNYPWELVYHGRVIETLAAAKGREKAVLVRALAVLPQNPYREPDYEERETSGRKLFVVTSGRWAISYWLDHFVCEVRIVSIEDVGS